MELQGLIDFLRGCLVIEKQVLIICGLDASLEGEKLVANLCIGHYLLACEEGEGADRLELRLRHELGTQGQFTIEGTCSCGVCCIPYDLENPPNPLGGDAHPSGNGLHSLGRITCGCLEGSID